ncbi:MAG: nucleoside triphosphate pyrophosphohydrolase [Eggerthellaceae bacterium]|nr:nucleoside triphosphate pyrophosphohydrolase [Eggerthellaceae bacterium]
MPEAEHPAFDKFVETVAKLRSPDGGCAWNRAQTHASIGDYMIEEAYEALDAIAEKDSDHLREELGDVLLQVVLHSQIAADEGAFTIDDVCATIDEKMIRRHPHVFGDMRAENANEVADLWEQVKLAEKAGDASTDKHLLDDVPTHFPALLQAQKISRKAVAVGFEWETLADVWDKVAEERAELEEAYATAPKTPDGKILRNPVDNEPPGVRPQAAHAELEFGDMLFALVNVARKMGIDAESALRASNEKFRRRFAQVEQAAWDSGRSVEDLTLDEMETYWQRAKEGE